MNDQPKQGEIERVDVAAAFEENFGMRIQEYQDLLPPHIPVARFRQLVITAIMRNPEILQCTSRSLWRELKRAATSGLEPDGKESALIVRNNRFKDAGGNWQNRKEVGFQVMVAGLRKMARNTGEVKLWEVTLVHQKDAFDYELGDEPYIRHKPFLGSDRGPIIACYSIAKLLNGEISREVMTIDEIEQVRDRYSESWKAFAAKKISSTPWNDSRGEMCRKTVAHRHSKTLPLSSDIKGIIARDDEADTDLGERAAALTYQPAQPMPTIPRQMPQRSDYAMAAADQAESGHEETAAGASETAQDGGSPAGDAKPKPDAKRQRAAKAAPATTQKTPEPAKAAPDGDAERDPARLPPEEEGGAPAEAAEDTAQEEMAGDGGEQPDPTMIAYERGQADRRKQMLASAVPPEYREKGREDEAEAWKKGHKDEDAAIVQRRREENAKLQQGGAKR